MIIAITITVVDNNFQIMAYFSGLVDIQQYYKIPKCYILSIFSLGAAEVYIEGTAAAI